MSTKTKFNVIYCNHMFHTHSIPKSTFSTPSTFPSLATEFYNPKLTLMRVFVFVNIWRVFHIHDRKYRFEINFCKFINNYSLIAECTKVKLLILGSFGEKPLKWCKNENIFIKNIEEEKKEKNNNFLC